MHHRLTERVQDLLVAAERYASCTSPGLVDTEHLQDLRRHRDYVNSQTVVAPGQ